MPPVSAVCVAQQEAHRLGPALASVAPWVDELIVFDGGSTDGTADVARSFGAAVHRRPFDGFIPQKRAAVAAARFDRVFVIDADERLDPEAGAALRAAIGGVAWAVRRRNWLDGRPLRASGWYPDWQVRLFDRREAFVGGTEPHDRVIARGIVGRLPGHLHHDPDRTTEALRASTAAHAARRAASLRAEGAVAGSAVGAAHAAAHLARKVALQGAWLDGRRGWTVAWIGAGGVWTKYRTAARVSATQPGASVGAGPA